MGLRKIENKDVELLNSFFSQEILNKFRQLLESVRTSVAPVIPAARSFPKPRPRMEAWNKNDIIWDWSYCYENTLNWYLGWGIAAESAFQDIGVVLPDSLQAFVVLTSDSSSIPLQQDELDRAKQNSWVVYDKPYPNRGPLALFKTLSSRQLVESPEEFNHAFQDWIVGTITEGVGILGEAHKHLAE